MCEIAISGDGGPRAARHARGVAVLTAALVRLLVVVEPGADAHPHGLIIVRLGDDAAPSQKRRWR